MSLSTALLAAQTNQGGNAGASESDAGFAGGVQGAPAPKTASPLSIAPFIPNTPAGQTLAGTVSENLKTTPGTLEHLMSALDSVYGHDSAYQGDRDKIKYRLQAIMNTPGADMMTKKDAIDQARGIIKGPEAQSSLKDSKPWIYQSDKPEPSGSPLFDTYQQMQYDAGHAVAPSAGTTAGQVVNRAMDFAHDIPTPDYSRNLEDAGLGAFGHGIGKVLHGAMGIFNPGQIGTIQDVGKIIADQTVGPKHPDLATQLGYDPQHPWDMALELLGMGLGGHLMVHGIGALGDLGHGLHAEDVPKILEDHANLQAAKAQLDAQGLPEPANQMAARLAAEQKVTLLQRAAADHVAVQQAQGNPVPPKAVVDPNAADPYHMVPFDPSSFIRENAPALTEPKNVAIASQALGLTGPEYEEALRYHGSQQPTSVDAGSPTTGADPIGTGDGTGVGNANGVVPTNDPGGANAVAPGPIEGDSLTTSGESPVVTDPSTPPAAGPDSQLAGQPRISKRTRGAKPVTESPVGPTGELADPSPSDASSVQPSSEANPQGTQATTSAGYGVNTPRAKVELLDAIRGASEDGPSVGDSLPLDSGGMRGREGGAADLKTLGVALGGGLAFAGGVVLYAHRNDIADYFKAHGVSNEMVIGAGLAAAVLGTAIAARKGIELPAALARDLGALDPRVLAERAMRGDTQATRLAGNALNSIVDATARHTAATGEAFGMLQKIAQDVYGTKGKHFTQNPAFKALRTTVRDTMEQNLKDGKPWNDGLSPEATQFITRVRSEVLDPMSHRA